MASEPGALAVFKGLAEVLLVLLVAVAVAKRVELRATVLADQ